MITRRMLLSVVDLGDPGQYGITIIYMGCHKSMNDFIAAHTASNECDEFA